jgi:hypothetical protein
MAHHTLTLNYLDDGDFRPGTEVLHVREGDTISFRLGTAPPQSTFKITMKDPTFFSAGEVTDSHSIITVVKAASTSFRCQLFDAAGKLLSREGQAGSQMEPMEPKQS